MARVETGAGGPDRPASSSASVLVAAVQTTIHYAPLGRGRDKAVRQNLYRAIALIDGMGQRSVVPDVVVLPEFFLTGFDFGRSVADWEQVACEVPGPETDALGEVAQEHGMVIAAGVMERDADWPGRWFNSAVLVGPNGDVVLRWRMPHSASLNGGSTSTSPGDLWSAWVERYGPDGAWPVVSTPFGVLACCVGFDVNFPETARQLALRGAEVILHPTGEPRGGHRGSWEAARRSRAVENVCYWVSANHGAYVQPIGEDHSADEAGFVLQSRLPGGLEPVWRSGGDSEIVGLDGELLAQAHGPGEAVISASLDLGALRRRRAEAHPVRGVDFDAVADAYRRRPACPTDAFLDRPIAGRADGPAVVRSVIADLRSRGVFADPAQGPATVEVAVVQVSSTTGSGEAPEAVQVANVRRGLELAERVMEHSDAKVLVFPEHWIQGFAPGWGEADWRERALGPDAAALAEARAFARERHCCLVTAVLVADPEAPGGLGEVGLVLGPEEPSDLVAPRWRAGASLGRERPFAWSVPGLFARSVRPEPAPVVRTPFGTLAVVVGDDVVLPELARLLTLSGAELVCHPTAEASGRAASGLEAARVARAYENLSAWATANGGPERGDLALPGLSRGRSAILGPDGRTLAELEDAREGAVSATVDLSALRRRRQSHRMNFPAQVRTELFAEAYREAAKRWAKEAAGAEAPGT